MLLLSSQAFYLASIFCSYLLSSPEELVQRKAHFITTLCSSSFTFHRTSCFVLQADFVYTSLFYENFTRPMSGEYGKRLSISQHFIVTFCSFHSFSFFFLRCLCLHVIYLRKVNNDAVKFIQERLFISWLCSCTLRIITWLIHAASSLYLREGVKNTVRLPRFCRALFKGRNLWNNTRRKHSWMSWISP